MLMKNKNKYQILGLVGILLLLVLSLQFVSAADGEDDDLGPGNDIDINIGNNDGRILNNGNLNFEVRADQSTRLENVGILNTESVSRESTPNSQIAANNDNNNNNDIANAANENSDDNANTDNQQDKKTPTKGGNSGNAASDSGNSNNKANAPSADAAMKSTGVPVIALLLVLIASLGLGISSKK